MSDKDFKNSTKEELTKLAQGARKVGLGFKSAKPKGVKKMERKQLVDDKKVSEDKPISKREVVEESKVRVVRPKQSKTIHKIV